MRAVVQRVVDASVTVAGETVGQIGAGLVVLLGVADDDDAAVADRLATRTARLRIFPDDAGRFARSVLDSGGDVLVVPNFTGVKVAFGSVDTARLAAGPSGQCCSEFTLIADTRRGHRPSFGAAAGPATAGPLFDRYVGGLRDAGVATVATGRFGAAMRVALVGDGPVTIVLDAGTTSPDRGSVTLP